MSADTDMVERVAETLANQIGMRKGCPPIRGCLALMPPEMAAIFRDDARAALDASGIGEMEAENATLREARDALIAELSRERQARMELQTRLLDGGRP